MSKLSIIIHPDPRLKKVASPITNITDRIKQLSADMLEAMYEASGVGLAAPQVGITKRLVVMDCSNEGEKKELILINPEIVWSSEENASFEEGCLSIPDVREEISRPLSVQVQFIGIDNTRREEIFNGLWATCIQHEIDHLNGKLFIDYLGPMKRSSITRKMIKLKKQLNRKK